MKKLVLLLFVSLCTLYAQPNGVEAEGVFKVYGKVIDAEGNPLAGAVVIVRNSMIGTSTDSKGLYEINLRRTGDYSIVASFMGYADEVSQVFIDSDTQIDFSLSPESIMGEAVIVSATRASSKMPIAQTSISSEELERNKAGFDIPYLLEMVPSVVAVSEGGTGVGNTSFRIRGTDMTRINVTVNGIPVNDPESQGVWWVNMPDFANSVDNIQIQRGVGTSTHGAGAFGATVNFQTVTLKPEPFALGEVMAGSFNTFRTSVKAGTGLINKRFSFETRYSKITSDGYIDRGWSDHQSLFFTGAWHTANSLLRFNVIHGEQHTGITWEGTPSYMLNNNRTYNPAGYMGDDENINPLFYPNESDNYLQNHYQLVFSHQFSNDFKVNLAGYLVTGEGYYEQFKSGRKLVDYGIEPIVMGEDTVRRVDMIRQKWLDNNLLGITYSLAYKTNKLSTILGGGWNKFTNDHFGNVLWTSVNLDIPSNYEWYRNNGTKDDFNIFLKTNYEVIQNLSLYADIQLRTINYSLAGYDDDLASLDQDHSWEFFNPKAGLFYRISPAQEAFFSVGVAHREPTRADIKDAMKYGSDQTPRHEKLIDYELGYNLKSQLFAVGLNLFFMNYSDQLVLTGKLSDVGYPLMTNVERSYRTGVEVMGGFMPTSWLRWDANLTLSRNRIIDFVEYVDLFDSNWELIGQVQNNLGETDISFSPSVVGSSQLRFHLIKNLDVSVISKYVGSQYIDNTSSSDRQLDAYFVNNLKIDYNLNLKGTRGVGIQLAINNILNEQYIANGWVWRAVFNDGSPEYREDGFFPQAGINFMGKVVVEF